MLWQTEQKQDTKEDNKQDKCLTVKPHLGHPATSTPQWQQHSGTAPGMQQRVKGAAPATKPPSSHPNQLSDQPGDPHPVNWHKGNPEAWDDAPSSSQQPPVHPLPAPAVPQAQHPAAVSTAIGVHRCLQTARAKWLPHGRLEVLGHWRDQPQRSKRNKLCWSMPFCFWCFMHNTDNNWHIQSFSPGMTNKSHGGPWWTFGLCSKSALHLSLLLNSSQPTRAKPHWFWLGHVPAFFHTCDPKWYVFQSSRPLSLVLRHDFSRMKQSAKTQTDPLLIRRPK